MSDIIISNIGPNVSSQFDELTVSQKTPIVELTSVYGLSSLRDAVTTAGSGTVTNNATEYNLSNTAIGIDSAILESVLRGRYEPGFAGKLEWVFVYHCYQQVIRLDDGGCSTIRMEHFWSQ